MNPNQQIKGNSPFIRPETPRFPFLFGAQYYRAPTPEPQCWEQDLKHMKDMGFNTIKYWVQWRWSHREPDSFYFEDLDNLMELAHQNGLEVTLNVIFDVAPVWLYKQYPDAKQVSIKGQVIEPLTFGHRQIGGHPGPCYSHHAAKIERQRFFKETLLHFRSAPAMKLWDIWNEPELCFPARQASLDTLVCYCPHCKEKFLIWLEKKYKSLPAINQVWGRCYTSWNDIELPRSTGSITDFIDWREFHLDTMAAEAKWRTEMVKDLDPSHGSYLHIVPNTWFSPVSAADDFSLAEECEGFGGTMIGDKPATGIHVVSAAQGRISYNAESHINFGATNLHQREINLSQLCKEFLPQIGLGVKGFLFWQYRPEVLGVESPAWGLVNLDGTERPVTKAAKIFWQKISPYSDILLQAEKEKPTIAVWRSRTNEIFHFCIRGELNSFNQSIEGWLNELYRQNLSSKLINSRILCDETLDDIRILIMPMPYYVSKEETEALKTWVANGGCLISEAHLGAYNASSGRHERTVPGGGLAESFGFHESFSSAPIHFAQDSSAAKNFDALPVDVQKALREQGVSGSNLYSIKMNSERVVLGGYRYAEIQGDGINTLGQIPGKEACIIEQSVGKGKVIYIGSHLGEVASFDASGMEVLVKRALQVTQLKPIIEFDEEFGKLHLDALFVGKEAKFLVVLNENNETIAGKTNLKGSWKGLFTEHIIHVSKDHLINVPPNICDLFIMIDQI